MRIAHGSSGSFNTEITRCLTWNNVATCQDPCSLFNPFWVKPITRLQVGVGDDVIRQIRTRCDYLNAQQRTRPTTPPAGGFQNCIRSATRIQCHAEGNLHVARGKTASRRLEAPPPPNRIFDRSALATDACSPTRSISSKSINISEQRTDAASSLRKLLCTKYTDHVTDKPANVRRQHQPRSWNGLTDLGHFGKVRVLRPWRRRLKT